MAPEHSPGRGRREQPSPRVIDLEAGAKKQPSGGNGEAPRVLVVDDDPLIADLITGILEEEARFTVERASKLDSALRLLADAPFDLLVTELDLGDSSGSETVRTLRRAAPATPVIVLSGIDDVEVAAAVIEEGADEYVVKGRFSVESLVWHVRLVLERHRLALESREQGYAEPADELATRPALRVVGRHLLRVADRAGLHLGVVFVGLDAEAGGPGGSWERLLTQVRDVLAHTVRRCDLLSQVARGELAALLISEGPLRPAVTRLEQAIAAAGAAPFVRIGFTAYDPGEGIPLEGLLVRARESAQPIHT